MEVPRQLHLQVAKRILRYVKGYQDVGVLYRWEEKVNLTISLITTGLETWKKKKHFWIHFSLRNKSILLLLQETTNTSSVHCWSWIYGWWMIRNTSHMIDKTNVQIGFQANKAHQDILWLQIIYISIKKSCFAWKK